MFYLFIHLLIGVLGGFTSERILENVGWFGYDCWDFELYLLCFGI